MLTPSLFPWTSFHRGFSSSVSSTHLMQCNIQLLLFLAIHHVNRLCLWNRMKMTVSNGSTSLGTLILACTMKMLMQASSQTSRAGCVRWDMGLNWSGSTMTTDASMYNMLDRCKVFMMRLNSKNLTSFLLFLYDQPKNRTMWTTCRILCSFNVNPWDCRKKMHSYNLHSA